MNNAYAKAYTEVLEILSYLPDDEYSKIPEEKINFYKTYMDKNYDYHINPEIDLSKQYISREANAVILTIYRDYFATERQKEILNNLLYQNQLKQEAKKNEKYSPDNLFKNNESVITSNKIKEEKTALVEIKIEKWYEKILNYFKSLFKK